MVDHAGALLRLQARVHLEHGAVRHTNERRVAAHAAHLFRRRNRHRLHAFIKRLEQQAVSRP